MRLSIFAEKTDRCRYRILCGTERAGSALWDGRGSFALELLGRGGCTRQLDAVERAALLGSGRRPLIAEGSLQGRLSTHREKDGLLGICVSYVLETDGAPLEAYPNPGGGRGWRMSVYRAGEQIALAKRASEPVHTLDGFEIVAADEDGAYGALLMAAYDAYASYLENDGGAAGPLGFRQVNLFGKRSQELDDPLFEVRCEGELPDGDGRAAKAPESAQDRAARLARGFAIKGGTDRRTH